MKTKILGLLAVALLAGPMVSQAVPISYQISAVASGSLGATSFTDRLITFSANDDTSGVENLSPTFARNFATTSFSIAGFGNGTITNSTYWFANQNCGVGIGCAGVVNFDALTSVLYADSADFLTYSLSTSIGPVMGGATSFQQDIATTAGTLRISALNGSGTFRAITASVPEPGTLALLSLGLLGLGLSRRKP